MNNYNNR